MRRLLYREELGVEPLDLAYAGSYWYAPGEIALMLLSDFTQ